MPGLDQIGKIGGYAADYATQLSSDVDYSRTSSSRVEYHRASLLASQTRVEAPFVRVKIGSYSFGVYEEAERGLNSSGAYKNISRKYPNYIKSLTINKINGTVNQYKLSIVYPVTENNDPNFFEKLFGTVSSTRIIEISYGDFSAPEYIYRDETAIITKITTGFDIKTSVLNYIIEATSTSTVTLAGNYNFPSVEVKPSDLIKSILRDKKYNLQQVFTGMKDWSKVEQDNLIASDDAKIRIPTVVNKSALDYIQFLVSYMKQAGSDDTSPLKKVVYNLSIKDDINGVYGGPYLLVEKIQPSESTLDSLTTYDIDIGYKSSTIVTDFSINNQDNWSIFYNYNRSLESSDYLTRINDKGELEEIYSPQLTGVDYEVHESDRTWWTKVTEFPITADMTIKGLLRPAILMTYVKLNVWFYGRKHASSGYYIITGQEDRIDSSGYRTLLKLTRIAGDTGELGSETTQYSPKNQQTTSTDTGYGDINKKPEIIKPSDKTGKRLF